MNVQDLVGNYSIIGNNQEAEETSGHRVGHEPPR